MILYLIRYSQNVPNRNSFEIVCIDVKSEFLQPNIYKHVIILLYLSILWITNWNNHCIANSKELRNHCVCRTDITNWIFSSIKKIANCPESAVDGHCYQFGQSKKWQTLHFGNIGKRVSSIRTVFSSCPVLVRHSSWQFFPWFVAQSFLYPLCASFQIFASDVIQPNYRCYWVTSASVRSPHGPEFSTFVHERKFYYKHIFLYTRKTVYQNRPVHKQGLRNKEDFSHRWCSLQISPELKKLSWNLRNMIKHENSALQYVSFVVTDLHKLLTWHAFPD